jgi:hypothetical protein
MQRQMEEINRWNARQGYPQLEMGIGINTGEVIVGNIGSEKRTKYGVVGSHVNLCGRIESYTIGGQILISPETRRQVNTTLDVASEQDIYPKGVTIPLKIAHVTGIGEPYNLSCAREYELPDKLDIFDRETFSNNPVEFYIGATDVTTGKPIFHRCSDGGETDIEWMRASSSMPVVSRPVQIGKYTLLDGGIADPIPYLYMESKGYDRNVLILTQHAGYRKQRTSSLMLRMLHNYPEIARAMARRHMVYNRQLDQIREREISGQSYVIRPPEDLKIGHIEKNPEELERVYQTGRHTAEEQIGRIREFLDTGR